MARIRPERRTPLDLIVSAAILVVVLLVGLIVWLASPVRHTENNPARAAVPSVPAAGAVPAELVRRWEAPSADTQSPTIARSVIVTADHGRITGLDPVTGRQVWSYRRNLAVCGVIAAWPASANVVLAAYRNSRGCGEITALEGDSGRRMTARSSDADSRLNLTADSGYVVAQGDTRLETWGSNLVRGIEYGRVDAPVKPDAQPGRTGCRILSSAIGGDRVAVIEHCDRDTGYRLTVLGAVQNKDEQVQQFGSSLITSGTEGPPPALIAMSTSGIAVYDGGGNPPAETDTAPTEPRAATIRQFNTDGVPTATNTVDGDASPPKSSTPVTTEGLTSFYTGRATVVLDAQQVRPIYQVPGAIGTGDLMAGSLLLPTATGISVRDAADGRELRAIPLPRDDQSHRPVSLRVLGSTVVEQQGSTLRAYGAPR